MEVDPPKDEGGDKKESANSEAAPAPNPEEPPKADQDAEMKDAEGSKAAEDAPIFEMSKEEKKMEQKMIKIIERMPAAV